MGYGGYGVDKCLCIYFLYIDFCCNFEVDRESKLRDPFHFNISLTTKCRIFVESRGWVVRQGGNLISLTCQALTSL
jgi:hypothetical protein